MSESNQESITPSVAEPVELDQVASESLGAKAELSSILPDVVQTEQPLEEALVKHNHLGNGFGFDPASPSRTKVPMRAYEYKGIVYDVVVRVAPNNTIDLMFKNTCFNLAEYQARRDDVTEQVTNYIQNWCERFEKDNSNKKSIRQFPDQDYALAMMSYPYSFSMHLKPLIDFEKMAEERLSSASKTEPIRIHALVQINLNRSINRKEDRDLIYSVRVNEEIEGEFFWYCIQIFKNAFIANLQKDNIGVPISNNFTMESVKDEYLRDTRRQTHPDTAPSPVNAYLDRTSPALVTKKPEKSAQEARQETHRGPDEHIPGRRETGTPGQRAERRAADALVQDVQRQLRQIAQVSYERNEDTANQLRVLQQQQAKTGELMQQMLEDNKMLFQLMNLLVKALGVNK